MRIRAFETLYLDAMMHLSRTLDKKVLSEKGSYIWKEWTSKKEFLDLTSKGSFAFKLVIWILR